MKGATRRPKERPKAAAKPEARIGPADWVRAGLSALARDGIDAVRVEPLAERLGVTKGSFYWHYRDRAALHAAMLESWAARATRDIIARAEAEPQAKRLQHLIEITTSDPKVARLETAIRSWARTDATVARTMTTIDAERIAYLVKLIGADGVAPKAALLRAKILYLALIGSFFAANSIELAAAPELWREVRALIR
jgi:AcrR family transcriptional regulator